ncbi:hypothetical protein [Bradyrhizobium sp. RDI18]|uniref:hypothetical protein n=1 Tax=Bradyrhizobium sp. RDI18 TaxID=3367400 RepID=UPI0037214E08
MNEPKRWEQMLVQMYPSLFVRSFHGAPFAPGYPICGPGWRDIVVKLVERISQAAANYPIRFIQISEKWGRLQIYWTSKASLPQEVEQAVEEAVALAEAASACTCARCGAEARLFSDGGWLLTACAEHARGAPVPTPLGHANAHLVRGYVETDIQIVQCRHYDRTLDAFVDVDPRLTD